MTSCSTCDGSVLMDLLKSCGPVLIRPVKSSPVMRRRRQLTGIWSFYMWDVERKKRDSSRYSHHSGSTLSPTHIVFSTPFISLKRKNLYLPLFDIINPEALDWLCGSISLVLTEISWMFCLCSTALTFTPLKGVLSSCRCFCLDFHRFVL